MLQRLKRNLGVVLTGLLAGLVVAVMPAAAADKPIKIGWTAWSDAEVTTRLAQDILEKRLGYKAELVLADIGLQYQGIANGDLDVMLMAWLPTTHKPYWDKFQNQVVDLGVLYGPARLGWAVPDYIPQGELDSFSDLNKPEVEKKLGGKIQGIDPGAGLMQASEQALKDYELKGYTLVSASDAAMTAALARALQREQWIVVTAWSPHWMFAKWKLRYLEDPKKALGGDEFIHAIARKGFKEAFPRAAAFIETLNIPMADLEAMMLKATESTDRDAYQKTVEEYIKTHGELIDQWIEPAKDLPQYGS